jgi:hypothetical protein
MHPEFHLTTIGDPKDGDIRHQLLASAMSLLDIFIERDMDNINWEREPHASVKAELLEIQAWWHQYTEFPEVDDDATLGDYVAAEIAHYEDQQAMLTRLMKLREYIWY